MSQFSAWGVGTGNVVMFADPGWDTNSSSCRLRFIPSGVVEPPRRTRHAADLLISRE